MNELLPLRGEDRRMKKREMMRRRYDVHGEVPVEIPEEDMRVMPETRPSYSADPGAADAGEAGEGGREPWEVPEDIPGICCTSRGTGRLVTLPKSVWRAIRESLDEADQDGKPSMNKDEVIAWTNAKFRIFMEAMRAMDLDGSDDLSLQEFVRACGTAGVFEEEATQLFRKMDVSQDGSLSSTEFVHFLALEGKTASDPMIVQSKYMLLKSAFRGINQDPNEDLSKKEFVRILSEMGVREQDASVVFASMVVGTRYFRQEQRKKRVGGSELSPSFTGAGSSPQEPESPMSPGSPSARRRRASRFTSSAERCRCTPAKCRVISSGRSDSASSRRINRSKTDTLSQQEFEMSLAMLGISRDVAKRIFQEMDADGSKSLSVEEFVECMQRADSDTEMGEGMEVIFG